MIKNKILKSKSLTLLCMGAIAIISSALLCGIGYLRSETSPNIVYQTETTMEEIDDIPNTIVMVNNIDAYVANLDFFVEKQEEQYAFDVYALDGSTEKYIDTYYVNRNISHRNIKIDSYADSIKIVYDTEVGADTKFSQFTINHRSFNFYFFIFLAITIFFILDIIKKVCFKEKINLSIEFVKISLIFGVCLSFFTIPYYSWDEREHFVKSYNLSAGNLVMHHGENIEWQESAEKFLDIEIYNLTTYQEFLYYYDGVDDPSVYTPTYYRSTAISYPFVPYIFSAAGIFFARIFTSSIIMQFHLGRVFNVLAYTLITYFAIKKSGKFKNIFFVVALLPVIVFQSASYSADVLLNACSYLSLAMILDLAFGDRQVTKKDIFMIWAVTSVTVLSKIAYFPLFAFIAMIPLEKYSSKKTGKIVIASSAILAVTLFLLGTYYAARMGLVQWYNPSINGKEQLLLILKNPFYFAYVIFNTLNVFATNWGQQFTGLFGYFAYAGDFFFVTVFLLLLTVLLTNQGPALNKVQKGFLLLGVISSAGAIASSLYLTFTSVGSNVIDGIQGRYFLPIVIPTILLFNFNIEWKINQNRLKRGLFITTVVLQLSALFYIVLNAYL